jgi:hypothetical protein
MAAIRLKRKANLVLRLRYLLLRIRNLFIRFPFPGHREQMYPILIVATNTPRPHPSAGECLYPSLGGGRRGTPHGIEACGYLLLFTFNNFYFLFAQPIQLIDQLIKCVIGCIIPMQFRDVAKYPERAVLGINSATCQS